MKTAAKEVMIIEDDRDLAESVKDVLEDEGFAVRVAVDGVEALKSLRENGSKPHLILLDIMMPNMDGFQFRREQKNDPTISDIPVVVMTADGHAQMKAVKAEAKEGLRKPVDVDVLMKTIHKYTKE